MTSISRRHVHGHLPTRRRDRDANTTSDSSSDATPGSWMSLRLPPVPEDRVYEGPANSEIIPFASSSQDIRHSGRLPTALEDHTNEGVRSSVPTGHAATPVLLPWPGRRQIRSLASRHSLRPSTSEWKQQEKEILSEGPVGFNKTSGRPPTRNPKRDWGS